MKRSPMPPRKTWMPRVNRERLARRRLEQFGDQAEIARKSRCYACGFPAPSEAAHVTRSRGAGGKSDGVVPLCSTRPWRMGCHRYQHDHGVTALEDRAEIPRGSLVREAARLADLVKRKKGAI